MRSLTPRLAGNTSKEKTAARVSPPSPAGISCARKGVQLDEIAEQLQLNKIACAGDLGVQGGVARGQLLLLREDCNRPEPLNHKP